MAATRPARGGLCGTRSKKVVLGAILQQRGGGGAHLRWLAAEAPSMAVGKGRWRCSGEGARPATCMDRPGEV
jgi:hypothetical protein